MKKMTFLILLVLNTGYISGQVSVNNFETPPHQSSMLDVESTVKGFLLPRMTMAEFEAIYNPAKGLLVYCIDDNNFFVNRGSGMTPDWTMVNSKWRANGPHIYYPGGNVGIGVPDPAFRLDIRGPFPGEAGNVMVANSDISHKLIFSSGHMDDPDPFIQWKQGDALRFATDEGGGIEKMRITSEGRLGIGIPFPAANLHVAETPFTYTGTFGTPISTWDFGTNVSIGDDNYSSVMYIGQSSLNKGYLIWHYDEDPSDAWLSLGTYGNTNSLVLQEAGGNIGIGTTDPSYLFEIQHDENSFTAFSFDNTICQYIIHKEDPANGDGQAALYVIRQTDGNSGTGYQPYTVNSAIKTGVYAAAPPDQYSFGVAGFHCLDDDRCGGIIGSRDDGNVWGSLGYLSSGNLFYGGYFTSSGEGSGKAVAAANSGIGIGAWGSLLGADIHGKVYGTFTEGENYALFANGIVYNNDLEVNLQENGTDTKTALYTNTSTDVTVQTSGIADLSGGKARVAFDKAFVESVSKTIPVVVFAMPAGKSNGVYLEEVSASGFVLIENNDGRSNVSIHYIAIGRREGYEEPVLSPDVIDAGYTSKMKRGLHNDADTKTNGEGLYYENGQLSAGIHPSVSEKSGNLPGLPEKYKVSQKSSKQEFDKKLTGKQN